MTVGDRLGPYEILSRIGAGGMGEGWKARDTRLGRVVAIKVSTQQFSERFEREARAIAALNHPHICTLYDVGPNYLVMEFVEGVPLKGPLPAEKAVEHAGQILDALDAAHQKSITHRDLKPAKHPGHAARDQAAGFWTGACCARPGGRHADSGGRGDGHAGLHVAGAMGRQIRRRAVGYLRFRMRPVRDAHRQARGAGSFGSSFRGARRHPAAVFGEGSGKPLAVGTGYQERAGAAGFRNGSGKPKAAVGRSGRGARAWGGPGLGLDALPPNNPRRTRLPAG